MLCWLVTEAANVSIEPAADAQPVQSMTLPVVTTAAAVDANLQRTQSARYAPEKRQESKSALTHCRLVM